jgi:hypothetical protein
MDDLARANTESFYSGHSGRSPLVLNHIEPRYKDKVASVPRSRLVVGNAMVLASAFLGTELTDEPITSGFPVIRDQPEVHSEVADFTANYLEPDF